MKSLTVRLNEELYKEFKMLMAEKGTTIQDHMVKLIEESLLQAKENKK